MQNSIDFNYVINPDLDDGFSENEMPSIIRLWQSRGFEAIAVGRDWYETSPIQREGSKTILDADSLFIPQRKGAWLHYQVKKSSVFIRGWEGTTENEKTAAVQVLISHANEAWGGKCAIYGNEDFKLKAWEEAYRQGVTIANYAPSTDVAERIKAKIKWSREQASNPVNELDLPNYATGGFASSEDCRRNGFTRSPGRPAPAQFQLNPETPVI